ncbi:MAG: double-strand break repair protein AddB [Sphingopyxis sp.]|nr:double-strand break repair protein AddB [Sphingopyxis sp.]
MATERRPRIFTIPVNRAFADALACGLIDRFGSDPLALAQGMILLPSNRARSAVQAAFVRAGGDGLLLPRLVALGDADLAETTGLALDEAELDDPLPPAVAPLRRRLILSRLIIANCAKLAIPLAAPASLRMADALARVIDQLYFEELDPAVLDLVAADEHSQHWQVSMRHLQLLLDQWPTELGRLGQIDLAYRRNLIFERIATKWREAPPRGFVVAAGVTITAPSAARLLRTVADMAQGMVLLPGLDTAMPDAEWDALGPAKPEALGPRPIDLHPQYQFKILLDRMGAARGEVQHWPESRDRATAADRAGLASALFVPSRFTADWRSRVPDGAAAGISAAEFPDDMAEARGIALQLRHALETPGQTAALVTPDRQLAARVASALGRWGLVADDSAGQPLAATPPGALARLALSAATEPSLVALLALLSHPLVRPGGDRGAWIASVRVLDLVLRGAGKPSDLAGIGVLLRAPRREGKALTEVEEQLADWWEGAAAMLAPLWVLSAGDHDVPPLAVFDALRGLIDALSDGAVWAGSAGRQLAALFDETQLAAPDGPKLLPPRAIARQFDELLAGESVRPPFGSHPRLFIWGLLEARLQRADLMILGGLNEGGWPAETSPDPWLAPGIRRQLGLPSLERAQGLAAHDFVTALGAPDVVVTRAKRQGTDPAVASRLWLRLGALAGPLPVAAIAGAALPDLVALLDRPEGPPRPAVQPAVAVGRDNRPTKVRLTALDILAKDPYGFYAEHILGVRPLERLGEVADPRWRGTRVHKLIEDWAKRGQDPATLEAAIAALAADPALGPVEAASWLPRIAPALRWVASELAAARLAGRIPVAHEIKGEWTKRGITITAKADRIDRAPEGLVVVDYKSGGAAKQSDLVEGRAMQLGLLAAMIEEHAFPALPNISPTHAEYWLLKADKDKSCDGHIDVPYGTRRKVKSFAELTDLAWGGFADLCDAYLLGDAPFTPGDGNGDYDHLARRDEWIGRRAAQDGP